MPEEISGWVKGNNAQPINEGRALYKYFKGGVSEWKKATQSVEI